MLGKERSEHKLPRIFSGLKFEDFEGYTATYSVFLIPRFRGRGTAVTFSLRKEVIQPQVLLRLPCYDFTPIMSCTLGGYSPCGLAHRLLVRPTFVM